MGVAFSVAQTPAALEPQVDGHTSESWSQILAQFNDATIYQTWAYGAVRWGARNLSHFVLRRDDDVVAAAQLRIARLPMVRAGVAYLRWGPMCHGRSKPLDPMIVAEMVAHLQQEYVTRRGLALQIIPHAFTGSHRAHAFLSAFNRSGMRPEPSLGQYRTLVVDLEPAAEIIRKQLHQKWRNQLNCSERNGLVLEVSDSPESYREFVRLYEVMRQLKQFDSSVDVEEFDRIGAALSGSARLQTFLAKKDGQTVAALVCSFMGQTGIYLLGATNQQARDLKAAYFLHWKAMMWLKAHGALRYDLGGIDPQRNPGGYHFKSGAGGAEVLQLTAHTRLGNLLSGGVAAFAEWRRRIPLRSANHSTVKP